MTAHLRSASCLLLLAGSLAACDSIDSVGGGEVGSTLSNMLRYGSTTVPPLARNPEATETVVCPAVSVSDGGAAVRRGSTQISIANVARECAGQAGGAVVLKVGVEGRALLGAGGGAGRFDVPVSFVVKRGDRVLVSRVRRVAVTIPPNDTQGSFIAIERDMVVPAGAGGDYDIEVGLGGGDGGASRRPRG